MGKELGRRPKKEKEEKEKEEKGKGFSWDLYIA
jgi:hypothetical protein